MEYIYIDENKVFHTVHIHNFCASDPNRVRVIGSIRLNPSDNHYPDKKWVNKNELFQLEPAKFSDDFIKSHSY